MLCFYYYRLSRYFTLLLLLETQHTFDTESISAWTSHASSARYALCGPWLTCWDAGLRENRINSAGKAWGPGQAHTAPKSHSPLNRNTAFSSRNFLLLLKFMQWFGSSCISLMPPFWTMSLSSRVCSSHRCLQLTSCALILLLLLHESNSTIKNKNQEEEEKAPTLGKDII